MTPEPISSASQSTSAHARHPQARQSWTWRTEWPTWLLIVVIYSAWFGIASHARVLGLPFALPALAIVSAWYMSLQHELLHGHPTRWPLLNAAFGFAPLALWFPYRVYKASHLAHHAAETLCDPRLDPESYFVTREDWQRAGHLARALLLARNTLVGRLLLGPALVIASTGYQACMKLARGDLRDIPMWITHALAVAALLIWLNHVCGISVALFIAAVAYPALSIASIRSFLEHRPDADPARRSVIVRAAWPWRLLFLNNNFHAVHHDLPGVPWFALPRIYRQREREYHLRSGSFIVGGYREWFLRFAVKPVISPVYSVSSSSCVEGAAMSASTTPMPSDEVRSDTAIIDSAGFA